MVLLEVTVNPGRLEDILRLGIKSDRPPMTGALRFQTQMAVLPGKGKISQRIKLNGHFLARSAHPTDPVIQEKLKTLSRRGEGKPKDKSAGEDEFDLQGKFRLKEGTASFPALRFTIPGAELDLDGQYGLFSEQLDFHGNLYLDAKLSQTISGFKSILLKPVDPFFRKGGKTVLPIQISGVRSKPEFKLELHRPKRKSHAPEYRAERVP
jgi:hypothetical protein